MPGTTNKNPKRQALLVLGMHRSGTSAISGVLASLGAKAPRTLLPQAKDNPKGFWESAELMKFHDRLLASSGSRWNDWEEFNPDWVESVVAEQFMEFLPPLIEQEFGDARLMLLKDPRMCRFVPFWLRALERLGIAPRVLVPIRPPSEVARSLQVRNEFGPSRSMLIWLRHVLDAELGTRGVTRSFIHYDRLLGDWRSQIKKIGNELDIRWPRWSSAVEVEIDNYLSSELRHQRDDVMGGVDPELRGWVTRTYEALGQLVDASGPQKEARAVLDEVRLAFGRSSAMYATVVREHEIKADTDVARAKRELDAKSNELVAANQEVAQLSTQLAALNQTATAQARELLAREADASMLKVTHAEEQQAFAARQAECETLRAMVEQQASAMVEVEAACEALKVAVAQRDAELVKQQTELEAVKMSEGKLVKYRSQADARLTEFKAIVTQLATENRELNTRNLEQAKSLEERYKEIGKLTRLVITKESEAEARFTEHRAIADRKIGVQEAELKNLQQELALMRRHWYWRMGGPIRKVIRMLKSLRPGDDQVAKDARTIRESGWLDVAWYAERYPDVATSGMDPALHYLAFGASEGRDPSPRFDTSFYVSTYADVAASGMNPLLHFIQYGEGENRKPR